jgi:hemerythrin-like domain-containing protein
LNAIELLEADHRKVKSIMDELESTTERGIKTRQELFHRLKVELTAHEVIEETIFYPALKAHPKARDIVLEGYEEHHVVDEVMEEIGETPFDDETWGAKAKVMIENIRHHIEEEEGEMFKQARQAFSRAELAELGASMEQRKKDALPEQEAAVSTEEQEAVAPASRGAMG